jgi:general secretion pathway protein G
MNRFLLIGQDAETRDWRGGQRPCSLRKGGRERELPLGYTLVELMLAMTILGILLTVIATMYQGWRDRINVNRAAEELMAMSAAITDFKTEYDRFPNSLAEIGKGTTLDPWGATYQYVNHADASGVGQFRKDKNIVPINSDYDLWSKGKDGSSVPPLTAAPSRDDVIRANDGRFFGLASKYDP